MPDNYKTVEKIILCVICCLKWLFNPWQHIAMLIQELQIIHEIQNSLLHCMPSRAAMRLVFRSSTTSTCLLID